MKTQAATSLAEHTRQALRLGGQYRASHLREVISPARLALGAIRRRLLDKAKLEKLLEVVVERAGANLVLATRLPRDLEHDAVPVEVSTGQRQQNMQCGWRERQVICRLGFHIRKTIYRKPNTCQRRLMNQEASFDFWGRSGLQELADRNSQ